MLDIIGRLSIHFVAVRKLMRMMIGSNSSLGIPHFLYMYAKLRDVASGLEPRFPMTCGLVMKTVHTIPEPVRLHRRHYTQAAR